MFYIKKTRKIFTHETARKSLRKEKLKLKMFRLFSWGYLPAPTLKLKFVFERILAHPLDIAV